MEEVPGMYTGRKRRLYQEAVDSLQLLPITGRDAEVRVFVKREKIEMPSGRDKAPRIISPRSVRYNVVLGRYLKPAEKLLFIGINKVWGGVTIAKGLNMSERGDLIASKWQRFRNPAAVGADATRFDQHVSDQALSYEHSIYNAWFRSRELRRVLRMQLVNVGIGNCPDGSLRYEVRGCRMSGDMNTSMGNCLLMCAMMYVYCMEVGVDADLINDGDDCVLFMETVDLPRFSIGFQGWFLEMGFDMKVEDPVFELEKVVFCQSQPVHVGGGRYIMVRNPSMTMAKDSVALVPFSHPLSAAAWLGALSDAGCAMYGGIPVLHSFYKMLGRSGIRCAKLEKEYDFWWYKTRSRDMTRHDCITLSETRYSFYIAFGILPDEQIEIEHLLDQTTINSSKPALPIQLPQDGPEEIKEILRYARESAASC